MNEKLSKYALIAEIVSALGVIASLIFVGLEIRQSNVETELNTRAIQTTSFQNLVTQFNQMSLESMTNPEFADLVTRVDEVEAVPPIDQQIYSFLSYTVLHSDMAYFQYKQGHISEEQLLNMLSPLASHLQSDVGKYLWPRWRTITEEFKVYVESQMRRVYPADPFWQDN